MKFIPVAGTKTVQRFITGSKRADIHVLPVGDLREHIEAAQCWCTPDISMETAADGTRTLLVVHHAADGRELVEEHGVN